MQQCIVHLARQSLRYVAWGERKDVAASLRAIYQAATVEAAEAALEQAERAWPKYPHLVRPWQSAWTPG